MNGASNTIVRLVSGTDQICSINLYLGITVTNAVVDGLTLCNGNNGAMTMRAGTVQNCIFATNTAGTSTINMSGGTVRNTTFQGNSGGTYGCIHMTGVGLVSNCVFAGNSAQFDGGAVHMAVNGQIVSCIITNNSVNRWGGGVEFESGSAGVVRNCLIARNSAPSSSGGGISSYGSSPTIESCTIVSNTAASAGGGIWQSNGGAPQMTNCIVYFNMAPAGTNISGTVAAAYSCEPDLTNGVNGNLAMDPKLNNLAGGDYRLARSPCLNTGTNMAWMTGALDLDGHKRIINYIVDMGAYESTYTFGSSYTIR